MDLFNNPMVDSARKALSPEQIEEYKRIGEYMYNNDVYKVMEQGSIIKEPREQDLILYATEALKSGLNPRDLTQAELRAIVDTYGDKWYENFGYESEDVPKLDIQFMREAKENAIKKKSRQEKRLQARLRNKEREKARKQKNEVNE